MKALLFISLFYVSGTHCQLIFPDEFEPIGQLNSQNGKQRPPFPSFTAGTSHSLQGYDNTVGSPIGDVKNPPTTPSMQNEHILQNSKSILSSDSVTTADEIYWTHHVNNIIARGVMKFALDMDRTIDANQQDSSVGQDRDNVVFSPISLAGTLAMVLLGSAGKTFEEVVKILGFESGVDISAHSEIVHQMFGLLLNSINKHNMLSTQAGPETNFAAGIFIQAGYPIRPEFLAISRTVYNNEVIDVNFMQQSQLVQDIINNWVNMRTHGKIKNILTQPPSIDTKVIFASALYFNGEWNQHFISSGTRRRPFKLTSGQTINVDMMFNGGFFPYYEDEQLEMKIVGLPYKNINNRNETDPIDFSQFDTTMYILLPTSRDSNALTKLESKLTPDIVEMLISKMENKSCIIGLPKMKLSSTLNLNRALKSLGLSSLFDSEEANLALLSTGLNSSAQPKNMDDNSFVFSRIGEEASTTKLPEVQSLNNITDKNNYFEYEDKEGGYKVQQWNNGVFVEKIQRSHRRKRSHSSSSYRSQRQTRPIYHDFIKFIENQRFPNYGLDILRNSANLINPGLFASDVIHKVEIDVTETGTIGAAATGVIIQRDGNSKTIVANKPFTFFIRHGPSRLMLFWGSINKPTPNYS